MGIGHWSLLRGGRLSVVAMGVCKQARNPSFLELMGAKIQNYTCLRQLVSMTWSLFIYWKQKNGDGFTAMAETFRSHSIEQAVH
jgi:hypothetical protein